MTDPVALLAVASLVLLGELNLLAIGETALAVHQLLAVGLGAAFLVAAQRLRVGSLPWLGRVIYVADRSWPSWACSWRWPTPSASAAWAGIASPSPWRWRHPRSS